MAYDFKDFTEKQRKFCEEYVLCLNAKEASRRAGYTSNQPLLDLPHIQGYIDYLVEKREQRLHIKQDDVLNRLWAIATADQNDLVQYRRVNCRFCYGTGHRYQWTDTEYERAISEAERLGYPPPVAPGGSGFIRSRNANPECPECQGEGDGRLHANDTRKLSAAGKALYAGVEQGRDGLKVKSHDQMKALELVGKHLGMFKDKIEHSGEVKNTAPVLNLTLTAPAGTVVKPAEPPKETDL